MAWTQDSLILKTDPNQVYSRYKQEALWTSGSGEVYTRGGRGGLPTGGGAAGAALMSHTILKPSNWNTLITVTKGWEQRDMITLLTIIIFVILQSTFILVITSSLRKQHTNKRSAHRVQKNYSTHGTLTSWRKDLPQPSPGRLSPDRLLSYFSSL